MSPPTELQPLPPLRPLPEGWQRLLDPLCWSNEWTPARVYFKGQLYTFNIMNNTPAEYVGVTTPKWVMLFPCGMAKLGSLEELVPFPHSFEEAWGSWAPALVNITDDGEVVNPYDSVLEEEEDNADSPF